MLPIIAPETRIILRFLFYFIAKTKPNISFYLGKQKHIFLCLGNNYRYLFTCRNKPNAYVLLGKTKNIFFLFGKQNQILLHLWNKTKGFIFT